MFDDRFLPSPARRWLLRGLFLLACGVLGLLSQAPGYARVALPPDAALPAAALPAAQPAAPVSGPVGSSNYSGPIAVPTVCNPSISTGTFTTGTQRGKLSNGRTASSCGAPGVPCGNNGNNPVHYDAWNYINTSPSPQCVTVAINGNCGGGAGI